MSFDPQIKPGDVVNNAYIRKIFKCSLYGGMNRSLITNTLVIITHVNKSVYSDRWIGNTFHYTGMGLKGDQRLDYSQNKTLAESNENRVEIHLFEVYEEKEYTYVGRMILTGKPYSERQLDEEDTDRQVWVFPLTVAEGKVLVVDEEKYKSALVKQQWEVKKLSLEELKKRAGKSHKVPGYRMVRVKQYDRDPNIVELAKRYANGICQLCKSKAPFMDKSKEYFLETHHIIWLSKGGEDSIENTVALCPNCHRKMHIVDDIKDIENLTAFAKNMVSADNRFAPYWTDERIKAVKEKAKEAQKTAPKLTNAEKEHMLKKMMSADAGIKKVKYVLGGYRC